MPACEQKSNKTAPSEPRQHSKDMQPLSASQGSIFFKNQFRTKIPSVKENFPHDATGKCAIITGSNTGLGFESARQLLYLGLSRLIMGVRSAAKGEAAAAKLRVEYPSAKIEVWSLDMASYDSIKQFADRCGALSTRIDIVILNAGLGTFNWEADPNTGHENTLQINHLSTVYLAVLLVPVLKKQPTSSQPPRLTLVNSLTAHLCAFENRDKRPLLESLKDPKNWPAGITGASERYSISKLLCQIFIVQLSDLVDPDHVLINMVDPGLTKGTGLSKDTKGLVRILGNMFVGMAGRTPAEGAATYVDAVLKQGTDSHGSFLMNCKVTP